METKPSESGMLCPKWIVRAGRHGRFADEFVADGFVAMGGREVAGLTEDSSPDEIDRRLLEEHPQEKKRTRQTWAATLKRFLFEVSDGDVVATYDPSQRLYFLGNAAGTVIHQPEHEHPLARRVTWRRKVPRDSLSVGSRNSLGSTLPVFRIPDEVGAEMAQLSRSIEDDLDAGSDVPPSANDEDGSEETLLRDEILEKAESFIEDRIARLSWEQMQDLVAGVLRAMGYRTRVSDPGPDRGVDIFASPDGLGLQEPRIFVEVKHRRNQAMGAAEIRSFLGGRQPGDRCLYVSTGGFSKDARYEADRANVPLNLIDLPQLRELLVEHYEGVDAETRALLPLTMLYWPVE